MGSPFAGADDYLATTGAFHSFVNHPGTATAVLIMSFALMCYFIYASYKITHVSKK
jgi:hypothetical protein